MRISKLLFWIVLFAVSAQSVFAQAGAISPGDKIHIWVKGEPDLTVDRTVESDGGISFPLVGNVGVAGLTPSEAGRVIARMLDDGFLRGPLVQVDFVTAGKKAPAGKPDHIVGETLNIFSPETAPGVRAAPLTQPEPEPVTPPAEAGKPLSIEVVDAKTGHPVGSVALLLGGKIYQSNRQGRMNLLSDRGEAIVIADGYEAVQGEIRRLLRSSGSRNHLALLPVTLAAEISVKVVDQAEGKPLSDVQVMLNKIRIRTNSQGTFRVKEVKTEFGEVVLSKKGYKSVRKILDFKDPGERTIPMIRDD
jgi:hypothetical protein